MKKLLFILLASSVLFGCKKDSENYAIETEVEFSLTQSTLNEGNGNQRMVAQEEVKFVLVSIEDGTGSEVYAKEKLKLYKFNDAYISEKLALIVGNYTVTEFHVLNLNEEVIYSAPMEGSVNAQLVDNPLPVAFSTVKDEITNVNIEVVSVIDANPEDFGYSTFTFSLVETMDFLVAVSVYDTVSNSMVLTTADISITDSLGHNYLRPLGDSTNTVRIKTALSVYHVAITKEGYYDYKNAFTEAEISSHIVGGSPLTVTLDEAPILPPSTNNDRIVVHFFGNGDTINLSLDSTKWHYLAVTKDASLNGAIYLDGNLLVSGKFADRSYYHYSVNLGASYYTSYRNFFNGLIDEVRISNRALNGSEINTYFNSGDAFTTDASTLALWRFDEGSGTTFANDAGSNGGTLYGSPTWTIGKFGSAVSYDGIDDRGQSSINVPEYDVTYEMWFKLPEGLNSRYTIIQPYGMYNADVTFIPAGQ